MQDTEQHITRELVEDVCAKLQASYYDGWRSVTPVITKLVDALPEDAARGPCATLHREHSYHTQARMFLCAEALNRLVHWAWRAGQTLAREDVATIANRLRKVRKVSSLPIGQRSFDDVARHMAKDGVIPYAILAYDVDRDSAMELAEARGVAVAVVSDEDPDPRDMGYCSACSCRRWWYVLGSKDGKRAVSMYRDGFPDAPVFGIRPTNPPSEGPSAFDGRFAQYPRPLSSITEHDIARLDFERTLDHKEHPGHPGLWFCARHHGAITIDPRPLIYGCCA